MVKPAWFGADFQAARGRAAFSIHGSHFRLMLLVRLRPSVAAGSEMVRRHSRTSTMRTDDIVVQV
jgi:hypothetical protein